MSTYLKHIENTQPVRSDHIFLNEHKFYLGVSDELIDFRIKKYLNEKIDVFKQKNLDNAPYIDIVGYLSDYNLITTELDCGGYCDMWNKTIAYREGGIKTIFHELGHAFQSDLNLFEYADQMLLSKSISIEQQCETIAYYLYNGIYREKALPGKEFDAYFSVSHVDFLADWYGECKQNDLIVYK